MISYDINNKSTHFIHELELDRLNRDSIHQLMDFLQNIFAIEDGSYQYILINAQQATMVPLDLLATELRKLVIQSQNEKACIAIVVHERIATVASEELMKTILERRNIELFTSIDKAHLWLTYLM